MFTLRRRIDPSDAHSWRRPSRVPKACCKTCRRDWVPICSEMIRVRPATKSRRVSRLTSCETRKPKFMTIHLSSLDEEQHLHGPFSRRPIADRSHRRSARAAVRRFPGQRSQGHCLVVSDHGFVQITHRVNLMQPFLRAELSQSGGSWKAQPWSGGGMAAVMLNAPADSRTQVSGARIAASPEGRSPQRHRRDARAGCDRAARRISRRSLSHGHGTRLLPLADATSPLVSEVQGTPGSHGFSPEYPGDARVVFHRGPGIARGRDSAIDRHAANRTHRCAAARRALEVGGAPPLPVRQ